ncbi:PEP-CTERM sorting domain-containing protein [Rubrivivax rivuli]|uniref:PEP-CTERM sorting domain-containing protein n=1 Tax=Rubrivivax rivuli TaxID=1862385 RepID=A0A437RIB4_9BURK|nr:PEP-CTERM sorting domain-containing protein [Rubrivivax rivuli]RVU46522.1 PEP-CTERM sorting domain-containing protein [Rubrivivax rivuli]
MFKHLALAGLGLFSAFQASAALVKYTDRALFQAAVSSLTVDSLSDITNGSFNQNRGTYRFDMAAYGCVAGPAMCNDNTLDGMVYPGYVWTYGSGTFTFGNAINAFGLDFGYAFGSASVTLAGITHTVTNGGFLGFIETAGTFTQVSYAAQGSGSLFDNVSYGTAGAHNVPEPGSLALAGLSLACLAAVKRRKTARG